MTQERQTKPNSNGESEQKSEQDMPLLEWVLKPMNDLLNELRRQTQANSQSSKKPSPDKK